MCTTLLLLLKKPSSCGSMNEMPWIISLQATPTFRWWILHDTKKNWDPLGMLQPKIVFKVATWRNAI
jgi:hypothetical protein